MRFRLVFIAVMLATVLAPAVVAAASSSQSFTVGSSGVSCSTKTASVSCQSATSARTVSATLTPNSKVAMCSQPAGASPGCILWPGAVNQQFNPPIANKGGPLVGRFGCIPLARNIVSVFSNPTGVVCTVTATGNGFRITAGKVSRVSTISPGPHPPCTAAAFTAALERVNHKSLAPSYVASSQVWCAGSYGVGGLIDVYNGEGDEVTVIFRAAGRTWTTDDGDTICSNGDIPARIWSLACNSN